MVGLEDKSNEKSFWVKVGGGVKRAVGVTARGLLMYPASPKNWFKPWSQLGHDIKNGWRYVIDDSPEEFNSRVDTTQASKDLGVEITGHEKGKVTFLASRTLTGDIPHLTRKQLNEIKKGFPNVSIFREKGKVVIEIDVEYIVKEIKKENPKMDEETIRRHAIKAIKQEIDRNLKGVAEVTGGEFKCHTDKKLLNGAAEKLYQGLGKPSEAVKRLAEPVQGPNSSDTLKSRSGEPSEIGMPSEEEISRIVGPLVNSDEEKKSPQNNQWQKNYIEQDRFDVEGNMTNPTTMYPRFKEVSTEIAAEFGISQNVEEKIKQLSVGLKDASDCQDVSSGGKVSFPSATTPKNSKCSTISK